MSEEALLHAAGIGKVFRTWKRRPGLAGFVLDFVKRDRREVVALAEVELRIGRGEFVGLIGANGAGKTTLVKCLTGITPVTSGRATMFGRDSFHLRDEHKRRLAIVMGQRSQLWWDLPAIDSFRLLREIYSVPSAAFEARIADSAARLDVTDKLTRQLRQLSLGERMKMEIIGAFLHEPDVVFLDEPTIGLDLLSRETIRRYLVEINRQRGVTIVLTSHDMEDIEETCRRLVILRAGRVLFDGELADLKARVYDRRSIELHLEPQSRTWQPELAARIALHSATLERSAPMSLVFSVPAANVQRFVPLLFELFDVRDLSIERQPLEHLIRQIFQGQDPQREAPGG
ncbi:MAG: ATP-binding cassette domain-containing protein [Planctomycetes bacterium]|nr:ATP-binding cassette domain-containing protein [Planctomycetota bacterium]